METVLYIVAVVTLLVFVWFLFRAARTLTDLSAVLKQADTVLEDVRRDANQAANEITTIRMHMVPVIDSVAEVAQRAARISEGITPRVEAMYGTIDDALDVAHGVIEDVERIKDDVVSTIESPLKLVRNTSNGIGSTIIKGVNLVREIVQEFKKDKTNG
jgi:hypothetical protein